MSEPTEAKIIKEKKPRSEAQLAILAEARIKAGKVRAENASIRKQEKDMAKELKEQEKADRVAKLKAHQDKKGKSPLKKESYPDELKPETDFVEDSSSGEEEIVIMKKPPPKKKKKKKKVRIVYESDSSQEEAPQRTQRIVSDTPPPAPIKTKQQLAYDCLRSQMFHGQ